MMLKAHREYGVLFGFICDISLYCSILNSLLSQNGAGFITDM